MRFSENWLRERVNPDWDAARLGHELTMAGIEVEAVAAGSALPGVKVGRVLSRASHPQADRLSVCSVDVGGPEPLTIVCGAANVAEGVRVPCATVGARLPGMEIRRAKLRGVESSGMLCSAVELGLAEKAEGLLLLPGDAPVGADFADYWLTDDRVFELKVTPNRGDCLSLRGLAREVAALAGLSLAWPDIPAQPAVSDAAPVIEVRDDGACPRYCGRLVEDVDPGAVTPLWMRRRLEKAGQRCLHPLVDITNYVLLELGQPMHAFDADRVSGGIQVRLAVPGETLLLLNEQTVVLEADMLVIADAAGPLALAGIMGGAASAVGGGSRRVLLESAFFTPAAIAGRARRLGLATDSSHRFERGVDFAATREALERATALVLEICGGRPGPVVEVSGSLPERAEVRLRGERPRRLLGSDYDGARIGTLLDRSGFAWRRDGDDFLVRAPSHRFDIAIEEDLVEEIARLDGYDHIPATLPRGETSGLPVPEERQSPARLKARLVQRGYQEVITWSFVDPDGEARLAGNAGPVRLLNPMVSQQSVMRSTLSASLLETLRHNLNRRHERLRIFELGACFDSGAEGPEQRDRLGLLAFGSRWPEQWGLGDENVDFFDLKGDVEALLLPRQARFVPLEEHPALHPGQAARIIVDDPAGVEVELGWIGALHPAHCQHFELTAAPLLAELDLATLLHRPLPRWREGSRLPAVRRDLAILVDRNIPVAGLLAAMQGRAPAAVRSIRLFDVWEGRGVPEGQRSLAFRVIMQDQERTFTEAEVQEMVDGLLAVLREDFGATLR